MLVGRAALVRGAEAVPVLRTYAAHARSRTCDADMPTLEWNFIGGEHFALPSLVLFPLCTVCLFKMSEVN